MLSVLIDCISIILHLNLLYTVDPNMVDGNIVAARLRLGHMVVAIVSVYFEPKQEMESYIKRLERQ